MDDAKKKLTTSAGAPVADNQNVMTAGPRARCCYRISGFSRNLLISIVK